MAISFVNSAFTQNGAAGNSLVINKPSGVVDGDLMIAVMAGSAGGTWTGDTGWTEVLEEGNSGCGLRIAWKIASGEGASYTFTSPNVRTWSGFILAYRGAAYDTVGTLVTVATSGVQTASAITLAASGSELLAIFTTNSASRTWSSPSAGLSSLATDSDATTPSFAIYSASGVAAGSTGSKSATPSNGSAFSCVLVGLRPAAAAAGIQNKLISRNQALVRASYW